MKKLLLILILLCGASAVFGQDEFPMPKKSDYPELPKTAAKPADFIPKDWKIMGESEGDLNGDRQKDAVLVIKGTDPKFVTRHEGLGENPFDTNPRIMAILFRENDGYKLVQRSDSFIAMSDYPTMSEPFQAVKITNGVLQFDFEMFLSAGGWGMSNQNYKFRYQNGKFELIGADKTETQRNTGEMETRSYNFVTGKVKVTTGNFEGKKEKVTWKTYKSKTLQTFDTLPKPFEWEIEKDYFL